MNISTFNYRPARCSKTYFFSFSRSILFVRWAKRFIWFWFRNLLTLGSNPDTIVLFILTLSPTYRNQAKNNHPYTTDNGQYYKCFSLCFLFSLITFADNFWWHFGNKKLFVIVWLAMLFFLQKNTKKNSKKNTKNSVYKVIETFILPLWKISLRGKKNNPPTIGLKLIGWSFFYFFTPSMLLIPVKAKKRQLGQFEIPGKMFLQFYFTLYSPVLQSAKWKK